MLVIPGRWATPSARDDAFDEATPSARDDAFDEATPSDPG